MTTDGKQALLLLTHKLTNDVQRMYQELTTGFQKFGDVMYLLHDDTGALGKQLKAPHFAFKSQQVVDLGFKMISRTLVPGSNHFPLILFNKKFSEYTYYWVVEFDVRFNGNWAVFFEDYAEQNHDFCSCHLREYEEEPEWPWWGLSHPHDAIPSSKRVRSFNTIYRISSDALKFIRKSLESGWTGHHEVMLPTLLHNNNFTIRDFGGSGRFVAKGYEDMYYTSSKSNPKGILFSGSMRYRPCITEFKEGVNKLYHPCK